MTVPANVLLFQEEATGYDVSQRAQESKTDEESRESSGKEVPEEPPGSPQKQQRQDRDEDEQVSQHQQPGDTPPPAVLIEVDEDGRETIISDHSTSAGFTSRTH